MELYKKFEEDLVAVSRKYGFEINMWYSPSKIPQPNFKAGRFLLDVDQLYHDQDFQDLINQHYPLWGALYSQTNIENEKGNKGGLSGANGQTTDLLKKNVEVRRERPDLAYNLSLLDFRKGDGDLRVRRSKSKRENSF